MSWVKNILQILVSYFIIANLTIACSYTSTIQVNSETQNIELVTSEKELANQAVNFHLAQQQLFSNTSIHYKSETDYNNSVQITNQKNLLHLKIQEQTTLKLKPTLLKIVLNDRIQSTTFCI